MDCPVKRKEDRAQVKILRILRLIDRMSGYAFPKTALEIFDMNRDFYRCARTAARDLDLLQAMGIVNQTGTRRVAKADSKLYLVNLPRSERLQAIAIQVIDGKE